MTRQSFLFFCAGVLVLPGLAGCAGRPAGGAAVSRAHPWVTGPELTRVVVSTYGDGNPSRVEYFREGRRLAVETFDEDGRIETEGAVPDGVVREFFEAGRARAEIPFRGGVRHGRARFYFYEGGIEATVEWERGVREGETRRFRPTGTLAVVETYAGGLIRSRRVFDPFGELIYEQEF